MVKAILAAILWLVPHVGESTAKRYAEIIAFEARWYNVHPALMLAIGYGETRWTNHRVSKTNDWGLVQIHVNTRNSNRFFGREWELFLPRVNIREGFRILDMWRTHHDKWCKHAKLKHPFWAHYKWGRMVKGIKHTHKTQRLFDLLVKRFWRRDSPRS